MPLCLPSQERCKVGLDGEGRDREHVWFFGEGGDSLVYPVAGKAFSFVISPTLPSCLCLPSNTSSPVSVSLSLSRACVCLYCPINHVDYI